ncbi:MAG: hypothetical protein QXN66_00825 [Thermoplasmatales archaeon]
MILLIAVLLIEVIFIFHYNNVADDIKPTCREIKRKVNKLIVFFIGIMAVYFTESIP